MRWASHVSPRDGREHAALLRDGVLHGVPETLLELLGDGCGRQGSGRSPVPPRLCL
jgi:hypothetical protein